MFLSTEKHIMSGEIDHVICQNPSIINKNHKKTDFLLDA